MVKFAYHSFPNHICFLHHPFYNITSNLSVLFLIAFAQYLIFLLLTSILLNDTKHLLIFNNLYRKWPIFAENGNKIFRETDKKSDIYHLIGFYCKKQHMVITFPSIFIDWNKKEVFAGFILSIQSANIRLALACLRTG